MFDINKYPKTLGQSLVVKKVGHNVVDTFFGQNGWENHARFHITKTKKGTFLSQTSGKKLPQHIFKQVIEKVT